VYDFGMAGLMLTFHANPEHLRKGVEPEDAHEKNREKMSGKIVRLILEKPDITIPELAGRLKRTERTIERLIKQMKADEIIGRIGPANGGHWEVLQ
jgi:ATP-dependent DNA helicase RecG